MLNFKTTQSPEGRVGLRRIGRNPECQKPMTEERIRQLGFPRLDLDRRVNIWREANQAQMQEAVHLSRDLYSSSGRLPKCLIIETRLMVAHVTPNEYIWLGLASTRVVTTVGVNFLTDAWQNSVELEDMKYHGIGTGAVAAAVGDTALGTELTTEYSTDNTRATGSLTEGASANIFRTVGTNTVDAGVAITEHGILDQAAVGGGTLWDRHVFSAINLSASDSLQSTYDMTSGSGG